ncbi:hypothetical protein VP01_1075g4 [Puccinia sorghi]|uniref:Uncharacterized protein n=1 Tax=Puccinia sorghi TaxID=27349 RepID=A0A0L6VTJ8_9BASI|nr:hypothetical protein VP01_1075g4 [Puccinia sorghi]
MINKTQFQISLTHPFCKNYYNILILSPSTFYELCWAAFIQRGTLIGKLNDWRTYNFSILVKKLHMFYQLRGNSEIWISVLKKSGITTKMYSTTLEKELMNENMTIFISPTFLRNNLVKKKKNLVEGWYSERPWYMSTVIHKMIGIEGREGPGANDVCTTETHPQRYFLKKGDVKSGGCCSIIFFPNNPRNSLFTSWKSPSLILCAVSRNVGNPVFGIAAIWTRIYSTGACGTVPCVIQLLIFISKILLNYGVSGSMNIKFEILFHHILIKNHSLVNNYYLSLLNSIKVQVIAMARHANGSILERTKVNKGKCLQGFFLAEWINFCFLSARISKLLLVAERRALQGQVGPVERVQRLCSGGPEGWLNQGGATGSGNQRGFGSAGTQWEQEQGGGAELWVGSHRSFCIYLSSTTKKTGEIQDSSFRITKKAEHSQSLSELQCAKSGNKGVVLNTHWRRTLSYLMSWFFFPQHYHSLDKAKERPFYSMLHHFVVENSRYKCFSVNFKFYVIEQGKVFFYKNIKSRQIDLTESAQEQGLKCLLEDAVWSELMLLLTTRRFYHKKRVTEMMKRVQSKNQTVKACRGSVFTAKRLAQLPVVDMKKFPGRFCSCYNHSPKVIQPSFDELSLCRLHSDCAKTSTYEKMWSLDGSLAGASCMSTAGIKICSMQTDMQRL